MERIKLMVNGVPGNVAVTIVQGLLADERFELVPFSLTGPEITESEYRVGPATIRLIRPAERVTLTEQIKAEAGPFISIDFTHPSAVNRNAEFYCACGLPFVMGTTGGDREALAAGVMASEISAIIAPNMAKQIVGFQAMMEYAATTFPGLFEGYSLEVRESHQNGKADTSGTARAMVGCFNRLGCAFSESEIRKERDPEVQIREWGVPKAHVTGHAWHTYTLVSEDGTARFSFTHNINGRDIYVRGTLDAAVYLAEKVRQGETGRVFSMIDVLKDS
ncbi:dihydrodipicolinate reductase [Desulfonema ishimotonii]|uniref:4-hydroxy-tetrahydrodipicolinate reductase n=1 Tax=Desulfonema ishimotonii TaxID=45657 RepID=A0A401G091_9BACT|nr:dihydrodipicolinate reductase [Desulfonema ishimotonii]GBC62641.1 dihydrodipicolinate reductase [Desulfonema ishimotonii]